MGTATRLFKWRSAVLEELAEGLDDEKLVRLEGYLRSIGVDTSSPDLPGLTVAKRFDAYLWARRTLLNDDQRKEFMEKEKEIIPSLRSITIKMVDKVTQVAHGRVDCLCGITVHSCRCPGIKETVYIRRYCCDPSVTLEFEEAIIR